MVKKLDTPTPPPARRTLSIAVVLLGGIGGLIIIAQLVVMAVGLVTAGRNTVELLGTRAEDILKATVEQVHSHLAPAAAHASLTADFLVETGIDLNPVTLSQIRHTMLTNPQIRGSAIILNSGEIVRIGRDETVLRGMWSDLGILQEEFNRVIVGEARWSDPVWSRELGETVVAARAVIRDGGQTLGFVATAVTASELSTYLDSIASNVGNAFLLDGRNQVVAHRSLETPKPGFLMTRSSIPTVDEIGDPVLSAWATGNIEPTNLFKSHTGINASLVSGINGQDYIVLETKLGGHFPSDWRLGISINTAQSDLLFDRLKWSVAASLIVLVISLLILAKVARAIQRPVKALAQASEYVRRLDVEAVTLLPTTRLSELAQASDAFNKMVGALRWFETYVPKRLVARIMRDEGEDGLPTQQRTVTILFTDIPGFTTLAEGMDARAVASLLNQHFTLIAAAVEAEGGVIDKYIGDSVMAFWGAPARQEDHADRAVRATHAIAEAIRADNARRQDAGELPVRLRIGLHDGEVVAGNIGAPSRINYTLVGDAVNIANRLEALGKEVDPDADVIALASADTVANAKLPEDPIDLGPYTLRGRVEPIEVYRLV